MWRLLRFLLRFFRLLPFDQPAAPKQIVPEARQPEQTVSASQAGSPVQSQRSGRNASSVGRTSTHSLRGVPKCSQCGHPAMPNSSTCYHCNSD